jgi:hypothetical protein
VLSRSLAYAFLYVYAMRAAAVFMLVVSTIGLRTGTLPRSLVLAGYAAALALLLIPTHIEWIVLFPPGRCRQRADPAGRARSPAAVTSRGYRPRIQGSSGSVPFDSSPDSTS